MALADETCSTVVTALDRPVVAVLVREVPSWTLKNSGIWRNLKFDGFRQAVDFINKVADLAEEQDHHPDMCVFYDKISLMLSTHKVGGLSRNDFIMAAKVERLISGA